MGSSIIHKEYEQVTAIPDKTESNFQLFRLFLLTNDKAKAKKAQ